MLPLQEGEAEPYVPIRWIWACSGTLDNRKLQKRGCASPRLRPPETLHTLLSVGILPSYHKRKPRLAWMPAGWRTCSLVALVIPTDSLPVLRTELPSWLEGDCRYMTSMMSLAQPRRTTFLSPANCSPTESWPKQTSVVFHTEFLNGLLCHNK